jgi:hypothetical protein
MIDNVFCNRYKKLTAGTIILDMLISLFQYSRNQLPRVYTRNSGIADFLTLFSMLCVGPELKFLVKAKPLHQLQVN